MGGRRVWDPEKVFFFFDHYSPPSTVMAASNQREMRKFAHDQGITNVFDIDAGVCHQVLFDHRISRPGRAVVITDSHTTTHGAYGAFSTGVGATDMASILLTGKLWIRVPEVVEIELTGKLPGNTMAKDAILYILGELGCDSAVYKAIQYSGSALYSLPLDQRAVLTNMSVEMGAKATYIEPDEAVLTHFRTRETAGARMLGNSQVKASQPIRFDISRLVPQVALPGSVDHVVAVADIAGVKVDQVYVGSCTGGTLTDLRVAADLLEDQKVAAGTRLVVSPASRAVYLTALREGYIDTIARAGGTIINPGCGPCLGVHQGLLAPAEVCVSTASRNFPGRMGSPLARIYVTSSATATATAIRGEIVVPSEAGKERRSD